MTKTMKRLAMAVALVLAGIVPGWAADTCFQDGAGGLIVAKGFSVPRPGQCKPLNGYFSQSAIMVTGGACATSHSDQIVVTLTVGVGSLSNGSGASFELSRSSMSGTIRYCTFAYECTNRSIAKVACPASRPFGPPAP